MSVRSSIGRKKLRKWLHFAFQLAGQIYNSQNLFAPVFLSRRMLVKVCHFLGQMSSAAFSAPLFLHTVGIWLWSWCYYISNLMAGFSSCVSKLSTLSEKRTSVSSNPTAICLSSLFSVVPAPSYIFRHYESHGAAAYYIPSDACWLAHRLPILHLCQ